MKNRRYKYRLKREIKETIKKIVISLVFAIADIIIYHYLGIYGACATETSLASGIIGVGWFWLLAGQFMALYVVWDK